MTVYIPPIVSTSVAPAVLQVLQLLGTSTTFTRVTNGAFNPANGSVGQGQQLNYTCNGINQNFKTQEIDNETVRYGDMKFLAMPSDRSGVVPAINDTCIVDNITYRVMNVQTGNLQGQTYLYTLHLRV